MFKVGEIVKLKPGHVLHVLYPDEEWIVERVNDPSGIITGAEICLIRKVGSSYTIHAASKHLELVTNKAFLYCKPCDLCVPKGAFNSCPECGGKMTKRKDEKGR